MINRKSLALFKYIVESYENLIQLSTLDPQQGIIELYIPQGNLKTVEKLLDKLKSEIDFTILSDS